MTKEVLKLALEALDVASSCLDGYYIPIGKSTLPEIDKAITAIKKALANDALERMAENARELGLDYEPEQEPVAWMNDMGTHIDLNVSGRGTPLYTTPPQRKPLTDEEIVLIVAECASSAHRHDDFSFARAIEAAHGIKGEA